MVQHNAEELERFRARLQERAAELRAEIDALRSEEAGALGRAPGGHVEDAGEQGEQRTRNAVRDAEQHRDAGELSDIDAALERLREGTYGECVDCGCAIPPQRLQVQPAAARCIGCQEKREQPGPGERLKAP